MFFTWLIFSFSVFFCLMIGFSSHILLNLLRFFFIFSSYSEIYKAICGSDFYLLFSIYFIFLKGSVGFAISSRSTHTYKGSYSFILSSKWFLWCSRLLLLYWFSKELKNYLAFSPSFLIWLGSEWLNYSFIFLFSIFARSLSITSFK